MKNEPHKDLVPFANAKPLVPGKGGGLRYWKQERDKQQLSQEVTDLAKVMRRLSQELVEELLFLKDSSHKTPEAIRRRMSQIMGALRRESDTLTSLFEIADLHPALQRIFREKSELAKEIAEPFIDLQLLEGPTAAVEKRPTLLTLLSNREIEVLTLLLAGHKARDAGVKLGISRMSVNTHFANIRKKACSLAGKEGDTKP
jgi:DNA-binding CsgD family transcriptional regulator